MRVLLVRPPRIKKAITIGEFMYSEPLGLEMVYACISDFTQVEIFDMMCDPLPLEDKLKAFNPQVVAVTSLCVDVIKVLNICGRVKAFDSNIHTTIGGTQTYLNPQAFMVDQVDSIFKYSTSDNIKAFYTALKKGHPLAIDGILTKVNNYSESFDNKVNEYILPDRTSVTKYRHHYSYFGYKPAAIMGLAQGCDKKCRFCLRWRLEGGKEHMFDQNMIEQDLLNIQENTIMIIDNDMISSSEKINFLCDLVDKHGLNKKFIAYGSVAGILANQKALARFKQKGLVALLVGYESASENEMTYYEKKSTTQDNHQAADLLKSLKIDVWASFMAHPDWTKQDFKTFRATVKDLKPQIASLSPLTPFPNLPLYKEYKDRLLYQATDFEKWSFGQVIITPSNLSLKVYYYELLKTNLYVNLYTNNLQDMVKKFGFSSLLRLSWGSIRTLYKYLGLMVKH